ncbi:MAG: aspartyl protease family protein [Planctomycetes bacterium]|nr:aspartyl protease family protein [Planctomycetota bacterium]
MKSSVAILIGLLFCLLFGCARSEVSPWGAPAKVSIASGCSLELSSTKLPLVEASLGESGSGLFLLDTAAASSMADSRRILSVGIPARTMATPVSLMRSGRVVRRLHDEATIPSLQFGNVTVHGLRVGVTDLSGIDPALWGILGMDVLRSVRWIVDAPSRRLHVLAPNVPWERAAAECGFVGPWESIPVAADALGWWVRATARQPAQGAVLEESISLLVDTGSDSTALPAVSILRLGLPTLSFARVVDISGEHDEERFQLSELEVGPVRAQDLRVLREPDEVGLLGFGLMSRRVFLVDGPAAGLRVLTR